MDAELTNKSRAALSAANDRAVSSGHADMTPAHLLLALLEGQDNENVMDLLAAVEADAALVRSGAERLLAALPSVQGSTVAPPQASRDLLAVIADATQRARELGTTMSPPSMCSSASPPRAARPGSCSTSRGRAPRSCSPRSRRSGVDSG
ncbi:hypothetical protein SANT12839_051390 [Streptomyces antimycoticus]|uniref:Clp R domain-containing protein n=1 Tax=Streptomyces antimycoticus TaxID=68175 RepID=A0A4D4KD44_9ACTN|nr:hypothetical protein SANT12839_051390 [Streptomyces antimycoticus]